jgi:hypothetical protein
LKANAGLPLRVRFVPAALLAMLVLRTALARLMALMASESELVWPRCTGSVQHCR